MKVKCTAGDLKRVTNGKMYDVLGTNDDLSWYFISNEEGMVDHYHHSHFTVIDEPVIEVGSEWVLDADANGYEAIVVTAVGETMALCKIKNSGKEFHASLASFGIAYKPKPKTVTMYFYKEPNGKMFADENILKSFNVLFTREIELP